MKTTKQIADELGIDKQRVYRCIKKHHISESHQKDGVMWYDDTAEMLIKSQFTQNDHISEVHQNHINDTVSDTAVIQLLQENFAILQGQLTEKDKQISDLTAALVTAQQMTATAQALHAGTLQQQLTGTADSEPLAADEQAPEQSDLPKRGIFGIFGKKKGKTNNG
jgi:predicted DNA-binding protein YlxM (UPF0122 family)